LPVAVSANGDAQISTAQSQFGGASALFDGTGDSLSVTGNSAVDLSGDFTIELFVRHVNASGNQKYLDLRQSGNPSTTDVLLIDTNNNFRIFIDGSDRLSGGAGAPSTNTWYHIAVVRNGTSIKYFLDGTEELDYTQSSPKDYTLDYNWVIAMNGDDRDKDFLNGYIDEFRVSNTARYTASFTPQRSAFENDANTLLLLHMDGTNGSTSFPDDNSGFYYAGGGGGGGSSSDVTIFGAGGLGGGSAGAAVNDEPSDATPNTGGGGGGARSDSANEFIRGGDGGSGVIVIRTTSTATATTGSPTVTTDGSDNIYKYTGSGSITF
jgi:hypothetical protein